MAEIKQNQSKVSVQTGAKSPSVDVPLGSSVSVTKSSPASAVSSTSFAGNSSEPKFNFDFKSTKFWIALATLAVFVIVALSVYYFIVASKKQPQVPKETKNLTVSSPVSDQSPPAPPPPVKSEDDKKLISDYFSQVSTNYKPEYIQNIPDVAVNAYKKYKDASGDAKLEAARALYIYLNSPGLAPDESFKQFVEDIKFDLEQSLGRKLF